MLPLSELSHLKRSWTLDQSRRFRHSSMSCRTAGVVHQVPRRAPTVAPADRLAADSPCFWAVWRRRSAGSNYLADGIGRAGSVGAHRSEAHLVQVGGNDLVEGMFVEVGHVRILGTPYSAA